MSAASGKVDPPAARYLNDLYAMFNDWRLVLAAYNRGEGKVQSLINKSAY